MVGSSGGAEDGARAHGGAEGGWGVQHFYLSDEWEQWSLHNHATKMTDKCVWASHKAPLKQFIFAFDGDAEYYAGRYLSYTPLESLSADAQRARLKEAEALGLPLIVLVCGATPGQTARDNYEQIRDGIGLLAGEAANLGIQLSIEPLHPIYAGDRSGICSLRDANNLAGELSLPNVGVAVDVYHVFWEVDLQDQLQRSPPSPLSKAL